MYLPLQSTGREFDSVELSKKIENLGTSGISQIVFLIGGSLGMSENLLKRADCKLSFSEKTFPASAHACDPVRTGLPPVTGL